MMGHFGVDKSYAVLRESFYWPGMQKSLEQEYIPSCEECQRNKSSVKAAGPLHPLPVPDQRGDSVAMDFIGPLPEDKGYNCILTMTDRLNSEIMLVPTRTDASAQEIAALFFDKWYCEQGLPLEIVSDRDSKFVSQFWQELHKLTGIKLKMSSAFHPQTDGSSERTNRTVVQALRFHVQRNQGDWVRALPRVRFHLMNTVNVSTGFSGFQLKMGRSPRVLPPLVDETVSLAPVDVQQARLVLKELELDVLKAKDALLKAKVEQASEANKSRTYRPVFREGELVMLSTQNRRDEYKAKGEQRVAKLMPRFDGPYKVIKAHQEFSAYTLDLPNSNKFPTFHVSQLKPFRATDRELFPERVKDWPDSVIVDGFEEWPVEAIIDERRCGRGYRYLVRFVNQPPSEDRWLAGSLLQENEALDKWLQKKGRAG